MTVDPLWQQVQSIHVLWADDSEVRRGLHCVRRQHDQARRLRVCPVATVPQGRAGALLRPVGGRWLERVLDTDPGVILASVEILRIEHSTAHFSCAVYDHRVPERDSAALVDADRAKDVISRRDMNMPA